MTTDAILKHFESEWSFFRQPEKVKAKKHPEWFAALMVSRITKGWAFMLSKDPVKAKQQHEYHIELTSRITSEAVKWIALK